MKNNNLIKITLCATIFSLTAGSLYAAPTLPPISYNDGKCTFTMSNVSKSGNTYIASGSVRFCYNRRQVSMTNNRRVSWQTAEFRIDQIRVRGNTDEDGIMRIGQAIIDAALAKQHSIVVPGTTPPRRITLNNISICSRGNPQLLNCNNFQ